MPSSSVRYRSQSLSHAVEPKTKADRLVIFDSRIQDLSTLKEGLQPEAQGHVLVPERDGIAQISALLCQQPTANLTLVAYGFSGGLQLGGSILKLSNLEEYEHQLRGWFAGFGTAYLSLLSSSVAKGHTGSQFIAQLESITGATVRASARPIGQGHWLTATAKTIKPVVLNTYSAIL